MNTKTLNPGPLGLAGFALTTWLLSMINAGWYSGDSMGLVLAVALAYGGTAQALAGLMEIPRGNTFGATAFLSYGAFWWSLALFVLFLHDKVPASFVGWYLALWGVFTLYMWIPTFRVNFCLWTVFLFLWITFFLLAGADLGMGASWRVAGGRLGLLTGLDALYLSFAEVTNATFRRSLLPVGGPILKA